jgi:two-component system, OmpR family, response regulator QseB
MHGFAWHPRYVATPAPAVALLVVEDDRALSAMLAELFAEQGYRIDTAYDGQQGLHFGLTGAYNAMIVDRGLPVMDGVDLIMLLRSRGVTTPALVLTARGAVDDRVEGLDAGAQDYLVKPFEVSELLARVRALVRRTDAAATVLCAGGLRLDRLTRRVTGVTPANAEVELSEREASLLATLMGAPSQVFSRAQLLDSVFDGAETPGAVDSYVHYLRRKLGRQVVRTVHRTGYRFGLE